ncbi:hypothetical protein TPA0909_17890 [Streptomyces albus]|nr:hypothetical protein TPA0909_17890 [Streptomyces albus]
MGLAAEGLFAFLVEEDDVPSGVGEFGRRGQAREPGTDHDHIGVVRHAVTLSYPCTGLCAEPVRHRRAGNW